MDKSELKRILSEQFVPLETAAHSKLAYLQGDNVFSIEYNKFLTPQSDDDSLISAFNSTVPTSTISAYHEPEISEIKKMHSAPAPKYIAPEPTMENINARKQNIAAKIAALRGISLPGDYIKRK